MSVEDRVRATLKAEAERLHPPGASIIAAELSSPRPWRSGPAVAVAAFLFVLIGGVVLAMSVRGGTIEESAADTAAIGSVSDLTEPIASPDSRSETEDSSSIVGEQVTGFAGIDALNSNDWAVLATGRSPNLDDLGTVSIIDSADEFASLLSGLEVGQGLEVPDFADVVVAAFTVPDGICDEPLMILGFETSVDAVFTPLFDLKQTRSCREALVATSIVVSFERSALPPGSSLRLPSSSEYGYPESVVQIPAD